MDSSSHSQPLEGPFWRLTREGTLYERLAENQVRCFACGHRCLIPEGRSGVCRVRFNQDGRLQVPYGYTAGLHGDPIEKKPFFHVLPGSQAMSFGMVGCNFHCAYCQNWITSQTLRDDKAGSAIRMISAAEIIDLALRSGVRIVTSTYNEPLITSEWAVEIFRLAQERELRTTFVSNGYGTPESIDYLLPWIDGYKVDLKSFQDTNYRKLGGTLEAVLQTIQRLHEKGIWVEIVTLIVPTFNDYDEELRDIACFIASLDYTIPWHVTAFHEDYHMHGMGNTPLRTLMRAGEIGKEEGLAFVYIGNVPGYAPQWENTYCHQCGALLIERFGFRVGINRIQNSRCPDCGGVVPGIWT